MALISEYYRKKFTIISHKNILEYFSKLKDFEIILFYEKDSYKKSIEFLPLDSLNIIEQVNIKEFNSYNFQIYPNLKILVIVNDYFYYSEFLYFLNQNFQNSYYDLYKDLLMDLAILNNNEVSKLFFNIEKLEKHLNQKNIIKIIEKDFDSYPELFKHLILHKKKFKHQSIIAFYYSHIYYDTFGSIINKIPDCIVFCDDNYSKDNFFYGLNYLALFDFIDIFLGTYAKDLPKQSMYINFNHGIIDDPSIALNHKEVIKYLTNNTKLANINIVSSELLSSNNSICLGYPKLDKFIAYYNEFKEITQDIAIVTSHIVWNFEKLSPVIVDSNFISFLLNKFPNNKILFRPHPGCKENTYIKKYTTYLKKYSNFLFDTNKSYLNNFSKTKVFISDGLSSSAYTYSFATLKPVIFYIPMYEEYMKDYSNLNYVKYMNIIGEIAITKNNLEKLVNKHLTDIKFYKHKAIQIEKLRNVVIKNISYSEEKIIYFIKNTIKVRSCKTLRKYYQEKFFNLSKKNITDFFDRFLNLKIAIYGAGVHFENILQKYYDFNKLNILFFCDKNKELIGKLICNIPVVEINKLKIVDAIIISSRAFEAEIKNELEKKYNNVYTIYDTLMYDFLVLSDTQEDKVALEKLWFEVQEFEANLTKENIYKLLKSDFKSYVELKNACLKD